MYKFIVFFVIMLICLTGFASRDPTKPVIGSEAGKNKLQLNAIFYDRYDSSKSRVIIDGQKFAIGDKVANAIVIMIGQYEVKLKDDNGEFVISRANYDVKTKIVKTEAGKNEQKIPN